MKDQSNPTTEVHERLDVALCDDPFQVHLHEQRYAKALSEVKASDDVLEIGTGLGVFSGRVAPKAGTYRGVEYDEVACLAAKTRVSNPEWISRGDAQALVFPTDSFDTVICLEVLEHLPDFKKALDEIARVLRPGGKLVASIPYAKIGAPSKTNPHHLYEPGEDEFRIELERRFNKVSTSFHRYKESGFETFSRVAHIRRFVGLDKQYAGLSEGRPEETKKVVLDEARSGMLLGIFVVASGPKAG